MKRTSLLVVFLLGLFSRSAASQDTERMYQQACDDGDLVACNVFGLMYEYGNGVTQDFSRAVVFYQRACEGGELEVPGNPEFLVLLQWGRRVPRGHGGNVCLGERLHDPHPSR